MNKRFKSNIILMIIVCIAPILHLLFDLVTAKVYPTVFQLFFSVIIMFLPCPFIVVYLRLK